MPQTVRVTGSETQLISSEDMEYGRAYVLVVPGSTSPPWRAGLVVCRGGEDGLAAIGIDDDEHMNVCPTVKVRELQPGERIVIQG